MEFTSHRQSWSQAVQTTVRIQYETFCDQRNTLLYRTLADKAHPFTPIQEEAQCQDLIEALSR